MVTPNEINPSQNQTLSEQASLAEEEDTSQEIQITDDLNDLLKILPAEIRSKLEQHPSKESLIEVVMDLGRLPEARFSDKAEYLSETPVSKEDLEHCSNQVGMFSGDNRAGIERTLHRISAIRNRTGEIIGLTCRIGRAVYGTIGMIRDLVETGGSILMLGRPGVGKTTALREIARVLADDIDKRVVIIDTSNEIAGDGDVPHPAIGRARRMQVARPELQHQVMIEAVENHMPEVVVIDEIGTELEALAARTIAERGVQLVGTAHGNRLENLIKNPTLSDLIGGIQAVTLGDEEARRRGSQKSVLERKAPPTFEIAVEMLERQRWVVHEDVAETIDQMLRGREPEPQVRTVNEQGEVSVTRELPSTSTSLSNPAQPRPLMGENGQSTAPAQPTGWRASGSMSPLPPPQATRTAKSQDFYPYGISRNQLEQVLEVLELPVVLTKDMDSADAMLALRSQVKKNSKLRQIAKNRGLSIHAVKAGTTPQITKALRRLLNLDESHVPETSDMRLFTQSGSDDEIEALEEARLAVEQVVIPKGQPVELLPRSAKVRKMQHEFAEHYRLKSNSFGDEPNRRLRIYPA
ncbi:MAG: single-stranded DNA-binding protein [Cyanobacteria bacterium SW_8_48_13]|nr:MAG: single-stranded DNA-binding protein [Cyanobacteria bacterium SW_8_48_13]